MTTFNQCFPFAFDQIPINDFELQIIVLRLGTRPECYIDNDQPTTNMKSVFNQTFELHSQRAGR